MIGITIFVAAVFAVISLGLLVERDERRRREARSPLSGMIQRIVCEQAPVGQPLLIHGDTCICGRPISEHKQVEARTPGERVDG